MSEIFVKIPSIYPELLKIRQSSTAEFKPNRYLKETTKLRYYQVIGALHMMLLNRMVLGDSAGTGKCVSEDTYIPTSIGMVKIGDLIKDPLEEDAFYELPKNFKVLSIEGGQQILSLYYSGKKSGTTITTSKGFELTGLNHHPIFCPSSGSLNYNRLDSLKKGDYVCINRKGIFSEEYFKIPEIVVHYRANIYNLPEFLNESLAELIGYYISEGCTYQNNVGITQFDPEINRRIRFLLKKLFHYEQNRVKNYEEQISIYSAYIKKVFEVLGINTEGRSGDKIVPVSILQSPKTVIQSFLKGYFEGDGGVEKRGIISCSSKSKKLITQLQLILLQFGIISRIKRRMIKVKLRRNPYWFLNITGKNVDLFKKEIGFVSKRKNIELKNISGWPRNTNLDIIPIGDKLLKQAMSDIARHFRGQSSSIRRVGWEGLVGKNYKGKIGSYLYGYRRLTYEGLKEFISIVDKYKLSSHISNMNTLRDILDKNLFFDKIISITPKESRFFDFHVPETHNFTGNGFINHNTVQTLAAYSFLLDRDPTLKMLVACPKSAVYQWKEEVEKFTTGITSRVLDNEHGLLTGYQARLAQYRAFNENILIMGHNPLMEEYEQIKQAMGPNFMFVMDEVQAIKGRKTKTHIGCYEVASAAKRVYGLSATVIKNNLEEVWSIYSVIVPGLFGSITAFNKQFCKQKLMKLRINGKDRYIPKTIGYQNLNQFKQLIDPYILARKKEDVAKELPTLISRKIILEMESAQKELYFKALNGIIYEEKVKREFFGISDKMRAGSLDEKTLAKYTELKTKYELFLTDEGKKRGKLAALTYCQMISDGPSLVGEQGESSKEIEFERLVLDELSAEKIIVFSRFKQSLMQLKIICERLHIQYVEISGDIETTQERDRARHEFQNNPDCRIIFITMAGSASLNLQAAGVVLFYDTPWSYGDLVQTIGRAQRIGSLQEHVLLIHLVNKASIDVRVMNRVTSKKDLSDEILGDTAKGALDFSANDERVIDGLFEDILEDAKEAETK
jgi:intein/homing endonuclease